MVIFTSTRNEIKFLIETDKDADDIEVKLNVEVLEITFQLFTKLTELMQGFYKLRAYLELKLKHDSS